MPTTVSKPWPLLPPLGSAILMAGRSPIRLQHVPAQMPATAAWPHQHRSFHHPQPQRRHARLRMGNDPLWDRPPPPCRRPSPS
ncbi:hypothetical protein ACHAW6_000710 [Cyclotella cf. meneghiniana]